MLTKHVACTLYERFMKLGEIRRSQVVSTYGPGALIPIDDESYMVAGTDFWFRKSDPPPGSIIHEPRLESHLGVQGFALPPTSKEKDDAYDLPLIRFPKWYSCIGCLRLNEYSKAADADGVCRSCGGKLIPSRFITICDAGHASDFPYSRWIHKGVDQKGDHQLKLKNEGKSAGLGDIKISCSCGVSRSLQGALGKNALKNVAKCFGDRVWLPKPNAEECDKIPRGSQRGASGVWQSCTASSISIPPWSGEASRFVDRYLEVLLAMPFEALRQTIVGLLEQFPVPGGVDELMALVENRKALRKGLPIDTNTMKHQEYGALKRVTAQTEIGRDFVCHKPPEDEIVPSQISCLHLVSRLREVRALKGFSRISSSDSTEAIEAKLSLSHKYWLPAIEVSGEGIFIEFDLEKVKSWETNAKVRERVAALANKLEKNIVTEDIPTISPRLLLVHTFSHILIDQWSLECGYPSASLRERIYVDEEMCGVLIYTATSDSKGSLGGIVGMAKGGRFLKSFNEALNRSSWCSNDPVCIESGPNGFANANLAACHSCVLLSETSCEMKNLLLDRGMLVGTLDGCPGFFSNLVG